MVMAMTPLRPRIVGCGSKLPSDASGSLAATNKANIGVRADLLVLWQNPGQSKPKRRKKARRHIYQEDGCGSRREEPARFMRHPGS
jgi:hypothetical protein